MARRKLPVEAWAGERRWLRRVIQFTGGLGASIEYDGRSLGIGVGSGAGPLETIAALLGLGEGPRELIRVNGREVRTTPAGHVYGRHSHSFRISATGGAATAVIEVEFAPLGPPGIVRLRLTIDDVPVYEEAWGRVVRESASRQLPRPAPESTPGPGALLVPGTADETRERPPS
jgi:hypothetical protein